MPVVLTVIYMPILIHLHHSNPQGGYGLISFKETIRAIMYDVTLRRVLATTAEVDKQ